VEGAKRGPQTPEGKARSKMNALKHGLWAQAFGLLPEESPAEWAEHLADLPRCFQPDDEAEEKLVTALAIAMWNEILADRTLVETMAAIPPERPGRAYGTDLHELAHARALTTAIRYLTAAGTATQRAQHAFLAHRRAKQQGLILPAAAPAAAAGRNGTNECMVRPRSARLGLVWPSRVGVNVSGLVGEAGLPRAAMGSARRRPGNSVGLQGPIRSTGSCDAARWWWPCPPLPSRTGGRCRAGGLRLARDSDRCGP
jgi:hypothetical protein